MKAIVSLDASNRMVLSRNLRRASGPTQNQKLLAHALPGRIVLEIKPNATDRIIKRGKLKIWTGPVPITPIARAIKRSRR